MLETNKRSDIQPGITNLMSLLQYCLKACLDGKSPRNTVPIYPLLMRLVNELQTIVHFDHFGQTLNRLQKFYEINDIRSTYAGIRIDCETLSTKIIHYSQSSKSTSIKE